MGNDKEDEVGEDSFILLIYIYQVKLMCFLSNVLSYKFSELLISQIYPKSGPAINVI